ncbi:MAG: D-3-phosphoglycerate dehydrogenase / 2-oxoglutarate reductase [Candidatus Atribacteria bacterium]|jgi:D-3-phosphoglycerate dehydrogenase|uniref:Hydroxyacid dehydrogenase n=1 Tax=Thermatribacter velox TaxID=3039681 RepID=A0ABZ2YD05_9BACT|nr:D-3-phosphoglycerate dehydrogenase / 2-oxoglutarate reductase [Candidatus Atribacteria bacterium]
MPKWKILLPQQIDPEAMDLLLNNPDIEVVGPFKDPAEARRLIEDVDGVIVRSAFQVDATLLDRAQRLKAISRVGVGLDNIDVDYACKKGIKVLNVEGENALSVAEHAVALLFTLAKGINWFDREIRRGNWKSRYLGKPIEVAGKTIGLVGFGAIGKKVAELALSLGMQVLFYDPFVEKSESGAKKVCVLEELLKGSDFVSLHLPLTEETRKMIGERELRCMQPHAFLINVARGAIVDEKALYRALKEGWIAGAAIDVFEEEPPSLDNPLLKLENVVLTPHVAGLTKECTRRVAVKAVENLIAALKGSD